MVNEVYIYGTVNGDDSQFAANNTSNALQGDRAMIYGENGVIIEIAGDTYSSKGIWQSWDANGGSYGDGVANINDNCALAYNPYQEDRNNDGVDIFEFR